ncbi:hypothetical protein PSECIP111951_00892 [Pseudoalteromonas holothuriae]|uniref:Uncharacterized protein n=1 Tax=Pseudoalteromonas holothuriae TaxID=2963714 RepID=A0A9W4QW28_9GAMM|nr:MULTISPECIES: DUF3224 domain-containing protein [unclassified Pseudoalteromonas]CAH9053780.1 hypothetical protein PSECIP111951_00892 [Pseudoalteromonas sp. CIP111951]CAH9055828.1 hypothetical protein PSECIP111854_01658 [Pseudoalteromonas sp. CIP111854]
MKLIGTFQIQDWQEAPDFSLGKHITFKTAQIKQVYTGDLHGQSWVKYQLVYDESGNAQFNGVEFIDGIFKDTVCKLTLMHTGKFVDGIASSQFTVIACEPFTQLKNTNGKFTSASEGKAQYQIGE